MKYFKTLLLTGYLFLGYAFAKAQDFSTSWTGYFSYNTITDITEGNGNVFAAADNAVFKYQTSDETITTLSTINGLSGETISAIYYSPEFDILIIGYENGLIDIQRGDNDAILSVVDIANKPSILPTSKRINHITEFDGFAYIATGFGISLFDLENLEFDDSYFIGDNGAALNITQTTVYNGFVYASTTGGGLRRALAGEDTSIDFQNWTEILGGSFTGVVTLGDLLYAGGNTSILRSTNGTSFTTQDAYGVPILDIAVANAILTVTLPNEIRVYDVSGTAQNSILGISDFNDDYVTAIAEGSSLYVGTQGDGVLRLALPNTVAAVQLLPNGPESNNSFALDAAPNMLWMTYGEFSQNYNPFPLDRRGISKYKPNDGWLNLTYEDIFQTPELVDVKINPQDTTEVFAASFNGGLLQIQQDIPAQVFNAQNSILEEVSGTTDDVRINGLEFNRQGDLYLTNSRVQNGIVRKASGGNFTPFSIENVLPSFENVLALDELVIANDGLVYVATSDNGILGLNPTNGETALLSGEDAANLPINDIRSLEIDGNGTLWIGSRRGLRVLFSPARIFTEPGVTTNPIIILENNIPQELLNNQVITAITIDGANNKWIGTATAGVFHVSPNGQETLNIFNKNNAPLPSNTIQDIAVDPLTGVVYFATTRGLVSFNGAITAPAEDLENVIVYPNPVRPRYEGLVTIENLTDNTNVKITDVAGNLVYEENTIAGNITWDTRAFGKHKVASGVYFILITGPNAEETQIRKLMIIR